MLLDRQLKDFAKKLARLSLEAGGQIDPARVDAVLASLQGHKPRARRAILKAYLRYLQIEDRRSRLLVEHAGNIGPGELEALRARLAKKYGRALRLETKENSALIAGLRASVADDIYESSVSHRLGSLQNTLG
ncbi:MAG TPA: F0F1 ATP synthase subunit delta [Opitutales bacterium]|nr:F0F1 ATP synthase subunit delta [Opitutales bacterium]